MSTSLNKVTILGFVGKTPEIRSFPNGGRTASMSVATSERWKDKRTGEDREMTEWHKIWVTSEFLVDVVQKHVSKGSRVFIEGKLQTKKWQDKNGADQYMTQIIVGHFGGEIMVLDLPPKGERRSRGDDDDANPSAPPKSNGHAPDIDSDIPF